MKKYVQTAVAVLLFLAGAITIYYLLVQGGVVPAGGDTMCHVYKGNVLYDSIKNGDWYPLYDQYWYNGVQMMRYWAPLPVYFLALCQGIMGGDCILGYDFFVAAVFFLGALAWLYIGVKRNRMVLGAIFGVLWFFMPNNLFALFHEGNLPRSLSMIFLPLFVHFLLQYLYEGDKKALKWVIPVFTGIVLCHTGYAGMIVLAVLLFLLVYRIVMGKTGRPVPAIISMVIPFLLIGIWLLPSLIGGITNTDSSQVMKTFFQDALISLNPLRRLQNDFREYYFGLSAMLIAVFGVLCSYKKNVVCFITGILIFLCTTTSAYALLSKLPGSQYLWMLRFISIALCFILFGLFYWDKLKKPLLVVCMALLVLDVIPSFPLLYDGAGETTSREALDVFSHGHQLTKAREITKQRMAVMDESSLAATGAYMSTDYDGDRVAQTFGAGWQSAATAKNISLLNESMDTRNYNYLFDRALEMGNDTVLVYKNLLKYPDEDVEKVIAAAKERGYELVEERSLDLLFHIDTYDSFGTICQYSGLGIGTSAPNVSLANPDVEIGKSNNINDYTWEELTKYKVLYLDGFTYDNKEDGESLLKRVAAAGVRVVINGDGIPINEQSQNQEFLGVTCHSIKFQNGYPILYGDKNEVSTKLFDSEYTDWTTVYFTGLKTVTGTFYDNGLLLDFMGKTEDEIYFVGLNVNYHTLLTHDEATQEIFDELTDNRLNPVPDRQIVPLQVEVGQDEITIQSDYDNVNTSLACHDNFVTEDKTDEPHNLLKVAKGTTRIELEYPYLPEGLLMTLGGIVALVAFFVWLDRKRDINAGN